jgi:AhpD family alkylhydroperoxidase
MSLANLEKMAKDVPESITALVALKDAVYKDGAISTKQKALIGLALGCAMKCNTCIETNAALAKQLGATRQEIAETLAFTMYMAGPSSVVWTTKVGEILGK